MTHSGLGPVTALSFVQPIGPVGCFQWCKQVTELIQQVCFVLLLRPIILDRGCRQALL